MASTRSTSPSSGAVEATIAQLHDHNPTSDATPPPSDTEEIDGKDMEAQELPTGDVFPDGGARAWLVVLGVSGHIFLPFYGCPLVGL